MEDKQRYKDYLKDKREISLPQLQKDFSCGYADALALMRGFRDLKWVGAQTDGLFSVTNAKYLNPIELDENECDDYASFLDEEDMEALEMFADRENVHPGKLQMFRMRNKDVVDMLLLNDLLHEFEGDLFLSVTRSSLESIKRRFRADFELVSNIAHPILAAAIENHADVDDLLSLPFMPDECAKYIMTTMAIYKRTGSLPAMSKPREGKKDNSLEYAIIESFLSKCCFRTKKQYENEALRNLERIAHSDLCPENYKIAAKAAAEEIINELTIGNIQELQKIIREYAEQDDDDDDDDD